MCLPANQSDGSESVQIVVESQHDDDFGLKVLRLFFPVLFAISCGCLQTSARQMCHLSRYMQVVQLKPIGFPRSGWYRRNNLNRRTNTCYPLDSRWRSLLDLMIDSFRGIERLFSWGLGKGAGCQRDSLARLLNHKGHWPANNIKLMCRLTKHGERAASLSTQYSSELVVFR